MSSPRDDAENGANDEVEIDEQNYITPSFVANRLSAKSKQLQVLSSDAEDGSDDSLARQPTSDSGSGSDSGGNSGDDDDDDDDGVGLDSRNSGGDALTEEDLRSCLDVVLEKESNMKQHHEPHQHGSPRLSGGMGSAVPSSSDVSLAFDGAESGHAALEHLNGGGGGGDEEDDATAHAVQEQMFQEAEELDIFGGGGGGGEQEEGTTAAASGVQGDTYFFEEDVGVPVQQQQQQQTNPGEKMLGQEEDDDDSDDDDDDDDDEPFVVGHVVVAPSSAPRNAGPNAAATTHVHSAATVLRSDTSAGAGASGGVGVNDAAMAGAVPGGDASATQFHQQGQHAASSRVVLSHQPASNSDEFDAKKSVVVPLRKQDQRQVDGGVDGAAAASADCSETVAGDAGENTAAATPAAATNGVADAETDGAEWLRVVGLFPQKPLKQHKAVEMLEALIALSADAIVESDARQRRTRTQNQEEQKEEEKPGQQQATPLTPEQATTALAALREADRPFISVTALAARDDLRGPGRFPRPGNLRSVGLVRVRSEDAVGDDGAGASASVGDGGSGNDGGPWLSITSKGMRYVAVYRALFGNKTAADVVADAARVKASTPTPTPAAKKAPAPSATADAAAAVPPPPLPAAVQPSKSASTVATADAASDVVPTAQPAISGTATAAVAASAPSPRPAPADAGLSREQKLQRLRGSADAATRDAVSASLQLDAQRWCVPGTNSAERAFVLVQFTRYDVVRLLLSFPVELGDSVVAARHTAQGIFIGLDTGTVIAQGHCFATPRLQPHTGGCGYAGAHSNGTALVCRFEQYNTKLLTDCGHTSAPTVRYRDDGRRPEIAAVHFAEDRFVLRRSSLAELQRRKELQASGLSGRIRGLFEELKKKANLKTSSSSSSSAGPLANVHALHCHVFFPSRVAVLYVSAPGLGGAELLGRMTDVRRLIGEQLQVSFHVVHVELDRRPDMMAELRFADTAPAVRIRPLPNFRPPGQQPYSPSSAGSPAGSPTVMSVASSTGMRPVNALGAASSAPSATQLMLQQQLQMQQRARQQLQLQQQQQQQQQQPAVAPRPPPPAYTQHQQQPAAAPGMPQRRDRDEQQYQQRQQHQQQQQQPPAHPPPHHMDRSFTDVRRGDVALGSISNDAASLDDLIRRDPLGIVPPRGTARLVPPARWNPLQVRPPFRVVFDPATGITNAAPWPNQRTPCDRMPPLIFLDAAQMRGQAAADRARQQQQQPAPLPRLPPHQQHEQQQQQRPMPSAPHRHFDSEQRAPQPTMQPFVHQQPPQQVHVLSQSRFPTPPSPLVPPHHRQQQQQQPPQHQQALPQTRWQGGNADGAPAAPPRQYQSPRAQAQQQRGGFGARGGGGAPPQYAQHQQQQHQQQQHEQAHRQTGRFDDQHQQQQPPRSAPPQRGGFGARGGNGESRFVGLRNHGTGGFGAR